MAARASCLAIFLMSSSLVCVIQSPPIPETLRELVVRHLVDYPLVELRLRSILLESEPLALGRGQRLLQQAVLELVNFNSGLELPYSEQFPDRELVRRHIVPAL